MINHRIVFSGLLMASILLTNPAHAYNSEDHSSELMVDIKNLGSENCYLSEKKISSGKLLPYQNIPSTLYATGETQGFIMSGQINEITLKYHCGNQKEFSIYMKNFWKNRHWHRSFDQKFDATDVFATYTEKPGFQLSTSCGGELSDDGCEAFGPGTRVSWVITH